MNRKIKFRMWNDYDKKIIYWNELLESNLANIFTMSQYSKWLMQYTGFNDRSGKEIYENDIVYVAGEDKNAIIEWDEETARFIIHYDGWISDFDNYYGYELEVIGNIYDNPELLGSEE